MAFDKKKFKTQMKKNGMTQEKLAEHFCVNLRTVSRWLDPKVQIKSEQIVKLCKAIGSLPTDFDENWEGPLEVRNVARVSARVSSAAKNGYWLLKKRYGVSETEICEIAPTLFALFAGSIYSSESEVEKENRLHFESLAKHFGFVHEHSVFGRSAIEDDYEAEEIDLLAQGKIFGSLELENKYMKDGYAKLSGANQFYQALENYAKDVKSVKLNYADVGECPDGRGVAYDIPITNSITSGNADLNDAISWGAIELFSAEFESLNSTSEKLEWMKEKMQRWKKEQEERMNDLYEKRPEMKKRFEDTEWLTESKAKLKEKWELT